MKLKLQDVMSKSDWLKLAILLVVAIFCWIWVYQEFQKLIISPDETVEEITKINLME